MRKVLSILLTLVIAIGIFVPGCAPSQPAVTTPPVTTGPKAPTGEPIKFGATVTLADITGKEASNAMLLAAKEINAAGGVLGRPLQIVIADDQGKGEVALHPSTSSPLWTMSMPSLAACLPVCIWPKYLY